MTRTRPSILHNRNLVCLAAAQVSALLGDGVYRIAVLWWVKERSGSDAQVAAMALVATVPSLALLPFAGLAADRFDRRRLMIGMSAVRFFLLGVTAVLAALGRLEMFHLYGMAFLLSSASAFFTPTYMASIRQVTHTSELAAANSILNASMAATAILGPAFGGWLSTLGPTFGIGLDAASFGLSALLLASCRIPPLKAASTRAHSSIFVELGQGLRALLGQRVIRGALVVVGLTTFFSAPLPSLLPGLAKDVLASDGRGFGLLEGSIAGGFVIGSAVAPFLLRRVLAAGRLLLLLSVASGALLGSVGFSHRLLTAALLLAGQGAVFAVIHVAASLFFQTLIPEELQGRGFGIVFGIMDAVVLLSLACGTSALAFLGVSDLLKGCGVGVAIAGLIGFFIPELVALQRPGEPHEQSIEPAS